MHRYYMTLNRKQPKNHGERFFDSAMLSQRYFSTSSNTPSENKETAKETESVPEEKLSVEELMKMIDMNELKQFNPKLYE